MNLNSALAAMFAIAITTSVGVDAAGVATHQRALYPEFHIFSPEPAPEFHIFSPEPAPAMPEKATHAPVPQKINDTSAEYLPATPEKATYAPALYLPATPAKVTYPPAELATRKPSG
jgi:hypothetical protein